MSDDTVSYTLRDIPAPLYKRLKECAQSEYRSVQGQILWILHHYLENEFVAEEDLLQAVNRHNLFDCLKLFYLQSGHIEPTEWWMPTSGLFIKGIRGFSLDELGGKDLSERDNTRFGGPIIRLYDHESWGKVATRLPSDVVVLLANPAAKIVDLNKLGPDMIGRFNPDANSALVALKITKSMLRRSLSHGSIHEMVDPA